MFRSFASRCSRYFTGMKPAFAIHGYRHGLLALSLSAAGAAVLAAPLTNNPPTNTLVIKKSLFVKSFYALDPHADENGDAIAELAIIGREFDKAMSAARTSLSGRNLLYEAGDRWLLEEALYILTWLRVELNLLRKGTDNPLRIPVHVWKPEHEIMHQTSLIPKDLLPHQHIYVKHLKALFIACGLQARVVVDDARPAREHDDAKRIYVYICFPQKTKPPTRKGKNGDRPNNAEFDADFDTKFVGFETKRNR